MTDKTELYDELAEMYTNASPAFGLAEPTLEQTRRQ
jgi:hypothetical protein